LTTTIPLYHHHHPAVSPPPPQPIFISSVTILGRMRRSRL
jgi:hypothetical protein